MSIFPRLKSLIAVVLFACVAQVPIAHAALLSLQPDAVFADNGDSVSFDLVVSGLGDFSSDSLGAFDVFVGYDASVLSFTGYSLGGLLGDLGSLEALDASTGDSGVAVNVGEVSLLPSASLDALQPGEFILASLTFDVLNIVIGTTTELSILGGAVLADGSGFSLPVTNSLSATIEGRVSVPLPGTLLLLLGGLFSWHAVRRLKKPRY